MADEKIKAPTVGKPWYRSITVQAVAAGLVVLVVLPRLGVEIPADYTADIYTALAGWIVVGLRNASGGGLTK